MGRLIKSLRGQIASMKLSTKISLLLLLFLIAAIVIVSEIYFANMRHTLIEQKSATATATLSRSVSRAQTIMNTCLATNRALLESDALFDALALLEDGAPPDASAERQLKQALDMVDRLTSVSTYVSCTRLYLSSESVPALSPTLRSLSDMRRQVWYVTPLPVRNSWKFNITDRLNPPASGGYPIAVYLNELAQAGGRSYGTLEISVSMSTLFEDMYALSPNEWMGVIDATGALSYDKNSVSSSWRDVIGSAVYATAQSLPSDSPQVLRVGVHRILVTSMAARALSGRLIFVYMLDEDLQRIDRIHMLFYMAVLAFLFLCAVVTNAASRSMLKRLYVLMGVVREVSDGNNSVDVPDMGRDEIGQFADDLRETLGRFNELLELGVNRELMVKTTEIRALQNQINSHFIYNVLEAIKMMAEIEERYTISDAVTSLGKLLRYGMKWASSMVTLQEELEYIQNYVSLLNLRYDFTISLNLNIPEKFAKQKIPKMSMQPIVENAVYHGIEELETDATIRINLIEYDHFFDVEITDTGKGMTADQLILLRKKISGQVEDENVHGGIGLRNVQERIHLTYGPEYGLRLDSKESCYTKVIIRLPMDGKESADGQAADR